LNESLFADDFKVKSVPDAVRQLTDELPLYASISLPERINPIYLGEEHCHLVGEIFPG
jgi:hypothetical protein